MTRGEVDVTVIVPVCNGERFLGECLDSLHAQTLDSIEFLLADDGSTDATGDILARAATEDKRMRVISKPNSGYGATVNLALSQARGTYVGIVEADDIVAPHMYAELTALAKLPDGTPADIVKASYWNYYDPSDGSSDDSGSSGGSSDGRPWVEPSNLMKRMPSSTCIIDVRRDQRVMLEHPSIWSAVYRRGFLEERGIRMVEAPGGGWVDNTFLFETFSQAEGIVWTPAAPYLYRQSNPASSSYLADIHLPFDRLRDIRKMLERTGEDDPGILIALYNREFDYIKQVTEKFGFPESDPELLPLIRETLESMDVEVLSTAKRHITREMMAYYEDVMGISATRIRTHDAARALRASIVVAMRNDRSGVLAHLASLAAQDAGDFEVICVDCGSTDRSVACACQYAARDKRFTVIDAGEVAGEGAGADGGSAGADGERAGGLEDAWRAGASRARGECVVFADVQTTWGKKTLGRIIGALEGDGAADVCVHVSGEGELADSGVSGDGVPDGGEGAATEAAPARSRGGVMWLGGGNAKDGVLSLAAPKGITSIAVRREFLEGLRGAFADGEGDACAGTCARAVHAAGCIAVVGSDGITAQTHRTARTALAFAGGAQGMAGAGSAGGAGGAGAKRGMGERGAAMLVAFAEGTGSEALARAARSWVVLDFLAVLDATGDLAAEHALVSSVEETHPTLGSLLELPESSFTEVEGLHRLQRLVGMDYERYLVQEAANGRSEARRISESNTYRIGKKIADLAPKILPGSLAMKLRRRV